MIPWYIETNKKLTINTIQYTGANRTNRSQKNFFADGGGVLLKIDDQNRMEIPAPVRIKKKLTATLRVSVKRYTSQFHSDRFAIGRIWFK